MLCAATTPSRLAESSSFATVSRNMAIVVLQKGKGSACGQGRLSFDERAFRGVHNAKLCCSQLLKDTLPCRTDQPTWGGALHN